MSPRHTQRNAERRQQGLTLVELMVVVAIIGVLAATAVPVLNTDADAADAADSVAARIADASREARQAGPVWTTVSDVDNDYSRTRLQIATDDDGRQYAAVELRIEDDNDITLADYYELSRYYFEEGIEFVGAEVGVTRTTPGGSPDVTGDFTLPCSPQGECGPATLYLKSTENDDDRYRVVVMPLATTPLAMKGW